MVRFIKSASSKDGWINDDKIEICFIGRSNVGKSTLINSLARQNISRTSNLPGRTQLINFFEFDKFRIIDLPGYGYAKVNKLKRDELNEMIFDYLNNRNNLYAVFQLCDCNVITEQDKEISLFLKNKFSNYYLILNKIDKESKSFFDNNISKISKYLDLNINVFIPVSAKKNININKLEKIIFNLIRNR